MSRLSYADYTGGLAGKVISRVRWQNLPDSRALRMEFEDGTVLVARMHMTLEEELELGRVVEGRVIGAEPIAAIPTRLPIRRLEDR